MGLKSRPMAALVLGLSFMAVHLELTAASYQPPSSPPPKRQWSEWSRWSDCSKKCGGGTQTRDRTCSLSPNPYASYCEGGDARSGQGRTCNEHPCKVDGGWTEWTSYGDCSARCGGGHKTRSRTCTNPRPAYGGAQCYGSATSSEACNSNRCPIDGGFTEWGDYSPCSKPCGGGLTKRTRTCTNPRPAYGGKSCVGVREQEEGCNTFGCPVDGDWTTWGDYGECSAACGGGTHERKRSCTNPKPAYGGASCAGPSTYTESCNTQYCPINGGWTSWGSYGDCTASCGPGEKTRSRECSQPQPQYGGNQCFGPQTETEPCNNGYCPVNGGWSSWSSYGDCSAECGNGVQEKTRTCTNPRPDHGGAPCKGANTHTKSCKYRDCPVDGEWTNWGEYGGCSASCGGGTKSRTRTCTAPAPAYGGADCIGYGLDKVNCNENVYCPVNGDWDNWSDWTACSNTCGTGRHSRRRSCTNPAPAYGGSDCSGDNFESKSCKHRYPCPIDGGWSEWGQWTTCTGACGRGLQTSVRTCTNPVPMFGGERCKGDVVKSRPCSPPGGSCGYNPPPSNPPSYNQPPPSNPPSYNPPPPPSNPPNYKPPQPPSSGPY